MTTKQDKRVEVRLSDEALRRLDLIAKTLGLSRSSVIKLLINQYPIVEVKGGDTTTPPLGDQ